MAAQLQDLQEQMSTCTSQPSLQPMTASPTVQQTSTDPKQPVSQTDAIPEKNQVNLPISENLTVNMEAIKIVESLGDHQMQQAPLKQHVSENLAVNMEGMKKVESFGDHQPQQGEQASLKQLAPSQQESLPEYRMNRNPRGLCLIINNINFHGDKKLEDRPGSEEDAGKLDNLFNKLHFRVHVKKNLSANDMLEWFKEVSELDHSNFDCFACYILSHGALGSVYGSDCVPVEIQDILSLFKPVSCTTLNSKPKMFFIQACQGTVHQEGIPIETDDAQGVGFGMVKGIPLEADFYLSYATVPGYVSYRSPSKGTWYVNALVDELTKHHNQHDMITIMTMFNNRLGDSIAKLGIGHMNQIPLPMFTLRKLLYLRSLGE